MTRGDARTDVFETFWTSGYFLSVLSRSAPPGGMSLLGLGPRVQRVGRAARCPCLPMAHARELRNALVVSHSVASTRTQRGCNQHRSS